MSESTVSYKETLNLPKTKFPMKANLAQREPEILKKWYELDLYNKMIAKREGNTPFILNDGPPYANGNIHIGHALNKILKDIVTKSQTLNGKYAPYIPGWDCHGLPIELQVEKKVGKAGDKVSVKEFRQKCREYASRQIDIQRESFKRLGVTGDWDNRYATMDFEFEANIIRTLGKVIENGYLVRGDRPVHWCVNCGSSLAEAEVEYQDKESDSIYVKYHAKDIATLAGKFDVNLSLDNLAVVIWTTTPWTLPASQAVTVHPNLEYVILNANNENFVIAEALVSNFAKLLELEDTDYKILAKVSGGNLENIKLNHPFYDREIPVLLGEHVTTETGTGCVHTAPSHGHDDYLVCKKNGIVLENPVGPNGCFYESTELVANLHIYKANPEIINILSERNNLVKAGKIIHSYPHCWRHKTPLIFRATSQWFISMQNNDLRAKTLKAIKSVEWIPEWGQERIELMIDGRPDWCISRQRTWGTPIPLLIHKETGEPHPDTAAIIEKVAALVEKSGIDAWFDVAAEDLISDAQNYQKISDTLDVWFDSGAVHYCVLDNTKGLQSPADLYLEGSDQHRGWFQTSLLSSMCVKDAPPYKQVLTHGFTVDAQGKKMSKSIGNVVAPEQVIKSLGADVLRLWVAATDYKGELRVSDEILKRTSDTYRRIRNTVRFLLSNMHDFVPSEHMVDAKDMLALDNWVVLKARDLQEELIEAYNEYQFHLVYQKVHNFCVNELGSFYLDIIKDRQYTCSTNGLPRRSCQSAMYYVTRMLVKWIAPILCFTADEVWQYIPEIDSESVFMEDWYELAEEFVDNNNSYLCNNFWSKIITVRDIVNKELERARDEKVLGSPLEAEVTMYCEAELTDELEKLGDELRFVLITSQAVVEDINSAPADAKDTDLAGLKLVINSSNYEKCDRCWHRREDVNKNGEHPNICSRCVTNITKEAGEERLYA